MLSERGNLLVHFVPAPVLARVATLTAWTRRLPADWLEREFRVAERAVARGAPVVPPSDLVAPGPHRHAGFVFTFWEYLDVRPGLPTGTEAGAKLAELHGATSGIDFELPRLTPVHDQIDDALHAMEVDQALSADVLARLRREHTAVLADVDTPGSADIVLHGDAHPGNLLRSPRGWVWTDLEESCAGPREWDLAVLSSRDDVDSTAALRAYAAASGAAVPTAAELAPFRRARELEATVWLLAMAHLYPERYRRLADRQLALLAPS